MEQRFGSLPDLILQFRQLTPRLKQLAGHVHAGQDEQFVEGCGGGSVLKFGDFFVEILGQFMDKGVVAIAADGQALAANIDGHRALLHGLLGEGGPHLINA